MTRTIISLDKADKSWLDKRSVETGRPRAEIVREAIRRLRAEEEDVRVETQIYLNRLSEWLFVISRGISQVLNVPEVLWQQRKPEKTST